MKTCKSAPSIQKQLSDSKLTACTVRTSYGHAHLLKFKVHFKGYSAVLWESAKVETQEQV